MIGEIPFNVAPRWGWPHDPKTPRLMKHSKGTWIKHKKMYGPLNWNEPHSRLLSIQRWEAKRSKTSTYQHMTSAKLHSLTKLDNSGPDPNKEINTSWSWLNWQQRHPCWTNEDQQSLQNDTSLQCTFTTTAACRHLPKEAQHGQQDIRNNEESHQEQLQAGTCPPRTPPT